MRVVGVGVTPDQIGVDESRQGGLQMLLTPAFAAEHADFPVDSSVQVRLRRRCRSDVFVCAARGLGGKGQAVDVVDHQRRPGA